MSEAQILRLPQVLEKTGLSRDTIYRLVKNRRFPRQVQLTERCVGWHSAEVNEWVAQRNRVGVSP